MSKDGSQRGAGEPPLAQTSCAASTSIDPPTNVKNSLVSVDAVAEVDDNAVRCVMLIQMMLLVILRRMMVLVFI